jgi:hypothetical protein
MSSDYRAKRRKRQVSKIVLFVVVVLAVLLVYPGTRWIVSQQFRSVVFPNDVRGVAWDLKLEAPKNLSRTNSIAADHSEDFELQLAAAYERALAPASAPGGSLGRAMTTELRLLRPRFSGNPQFLAAYLRYSGFLTADFQEERWESSVTGSPPQPISAAFLSSQQELDEALDIAKAGEQSDPDNAYFPYTSAWTLFALHRHFDALDAIKRAGACNTWDDYAGAEADGRVAMAREVYGNIDAVHSMSIQASVLLPHYAKMRQTARVALARIAGTEMDGHPNEGLALRHHLMRYGGLMRAQSRNIIGSLVGASISDIATSRPSGAPLVKADTENPQAIKEAQAVQAERYISYIRIYANEANAKWVRAEIDENNRVRGIQEQKFIEGSLDGYEATVRATIPWSVGTLILCNALILFALAGAVKLAAMWKPRRFLWLVRFGASAVFVWAVNAQVQAIGHSQAARTWLFLRQPLNVRPVVQDWWLLSAIIVPLVVVVVIGLVSMRCRVKLATGLGRGLRGLAVPVACGLMLIFAVNVPFTARMDAKAQDAMAVQSLHEGRFISGETSAKWPGTPPPVPVVDRGGANASR